MDNEADAVNETRELKGAAVWARQMLAMSRGMQSVQPAVINGAVGLVFAPLGKLALVLTFTLADARLTGIEVIGDPVRLRELDIVVN